MFQWKTRMQVDALCCSCSTWKHLKTVAILQGVSEWDVLMAVCGYLVCVRMFEWNRRSVVIVCGTGGLLPANIEVPAQFQQFTAIILAAINCIDNDPILCTSHKADTSNVFLVRPWTVHVSLTEYWASTGPLCVLNWLWSNLRDTLVGPI